MEESAIVVILSVIIWVAFFASFAKDKERRRRERKEYLKNQERRKERQALHASQVQSTNQHPVNQAALRWINEVELDTNSKNPDEVKLADSEVYIMKYLMWSIDLLSDQECLEDEMQLDIEYALEHICLNDGPEKQTGYFLEHLERDDFQRLDEFKDAANRYQSARLVVDMFEKVILDNPHLRYDPDEEYYWHDPDGRRRPV